MASTMTKVQRSGRRMARVNPTVWTAGLTVAVLAGALALCPSLLAHASPVSRPFSLPWWALVVPFAATENFVFHLEIHREAHSFSFSEVPLVVALFFANPLALIVGRLIGEAIVLVFRERQPALKLALNLATFFAECAVAVTVFRWAAGNANPLHASSWAAAFLAIAVADLLSIATVSLAIVWHGGRPRWEQLAVAGGITLLANTALGLIAVILLWVTPLATALLAVLALILCAAYRGYSALDQRYSSLHLLYDFTRLVNDSTRAEAVMEAMLDQTRRLLRATTAEITLHEAPDQPLRWRMDDDQVLQLAPLPTRDGSASLLAEIVRQGEARVIPRA